MMTVLFLEAGLSAWSIHREVLGSPFCAAKTRQSLSLGRGCPSARCRRRRVTSSADPRVTLIGPNGAGDHVGHLLTGCSAGAGTIRLGGRPSAS
jgi:hypothetical protein